MMTSNSVTVQEQRSDTLIASNNSNTTSEKETRSLPSTDEESAYMGEHDFMGVEVDDLPTLVAANEAHTLPSSSPSKAPPVTSTEKKNTTKKQKKTRKKSFLSFGKKDKKKEKPPRWEVIPVPNVVETKSVTGEVSVLGESIDRRTVPKQHSAGVLAPGKPPIKLNNKERRRSFNMFAKSSRKKSIQQTKEEQIPVPQVIGPPVVTPPTSPVSLVEAAPQAEVSSITYSEPANKIDKTQPLQQKPETSKAPPMNDDDSVEDVAAGISRKWALFFSKEEGEALSSDEESSQEPDYEENFFPRAVPASDMPPSEIVRLSTDGSVNDGVSVITSEVQSTMRETSEKDLVDPSGGNNYVAPWMTLNAFTRSGVEVSDTTAAGDDDDSVEVPVMQKEDTLPEKETEEPVKSVEIAPEEAAPIVTEPQLTSSESGTDVESATPEDAPVTVSEENAKNDDDDSIDAPEAVVAAQEVAKDSNDETQDEPQDKYAVNMNTDVSEQGCDDASIDDALRISGDAIEKEPTTEPSVEDDENKEQETQPTPSEGVSIIESALASFMSGVWGHDTGDVEVVAPMEDPTTESETVSFNDPSLTNTLESAVTLEAGEDNVGATKPASDGIITQRKAQLEALAADISVKDGAASVELSVHSESSGVESRKGSFKARLNHLLSKDNASEKPADKNADSGSSKRDPDEAELEEELNAFFEQLDEETVKSDVDIKTMDGELSAITFAESACFPQQARAFSPTALALTEFDEEAFEETVKKQVTFASPSALHQVNVQNTIESKWAAFMDGILTACGGGTDDVQGNSVFLGSEESFSGNGDSVNYDFDDTTTLGDEDTMDPFKLLDFFDGASLDDTILTALDDSTLQDDGSARSGSVRKVRGLLQKKESERSVGSAIEDESSVRKFREVLHEYKKGSEKAIAERAVAERVVAEDDDTEFDDTIFDTVMEDKAPQSPGQDIQERVEAALKSDIESSEKENVLTDDNVDVVPADDDNKSKENTPPTSTGNASELVPPKSRDKAIEDISKAMATLKKYAARHGVSEPELLWKIQEEHKKRKGWSASMADF